MALATKDATVPARDAHAFSRVKPISEAYRPNLWKRTVNKMKAAAAALAAVAVISTSMQLKADEDASLKPEVVTTRENKGFMMMNSMRLCGYSHYPSRLEFNVDKKPLDLPGHGFLVHYSILQELEGTPSGFYRSIYLMEFGMGYALNFRHVTFGTAAVLSNFVEQNGVFPSSDLSLRVPVSYGRFIDIGGFIAADLYRSDALNVVLHMGVTTRPILEISRHGIPLSKEFVPYIGFTFDF